MLSTTVSLTVLQNIIHKIKQQWKQTNWRQGRVESQPENLADMAPYPSLHTVVMRVSKYYTRKYIGAGIQPNRRTYQFGNPNSFFCWRLLGLIPGGAPFSQLSSGVKDAMVVFTRLVKCHFMTKTCRKAGWNRDRSNYKSKCVDCHRTR